MEQLKSIEENLNMAIGTLNLVIEKLEEIQDRDGISELCNIIAGITLSKNVIVETADDITELIIQ